MNHSPKVVVQFPICTILFITFLVLKLTGTIDWSWWWVTAPIWIPVVLVLGFVVCAFILIFAGVMDK